MRAILTSSKSTKIFIALLVFWLASAFFLPANRTTMALYDITAAQYSYLLFLVRLPIAIVWISVFYSYRMLHSYAVSLKDTPEGEEFNALRRGLLWMAWGFPIPAIASVLLHSIANQQDTFYSTALIISNYLYLVFSLVAFSYICGGGHRLATRSRVILATKHIRTLIAGLIVLGVLFCILITARLTDPETLANSMNAYHLPNVLVWVTIVMPYLYAWFVGLFAAMEIMLVARRSKGIIYRQGLQLLAIGLVTVIVSMCMLQYFRSVVPRTGYLTLGGTLVTTYVINFLTGVGSVLVALGARRLKRIEDA
jgi:hypothetical protein